jgi:hypothetical protein
MPTVATGLEAVCPQIVTENINLRLLHVVTSAGGH